MNNKNSTDHELAEEFKEYLRIIGNEFTDPIKQQVQNHSDNVNELKELIYQTTAALKENKDSFNKEIDNLNKELNNNVKSSLQSKADDIHYQFDKLMNDQKDLFDQQLNKLNEDMQIKMDLYELRTRKSIKEGLESINKKVNTVTVPGFILAALLSINLGLTIFILTKLI